MMITGTTNGGLSHVDGGVEDPVDAGHSPDPVLIAIHDLEPAADLGPFAAHGVVVADPTPLVDEVVMVDTHDVAVTRDDVSQLALHLVANTAMMVMILRMIMILRIMMLIL